MPRPPNIPIRKSKVPLMLASQRTQLTALVEEALALHQKGYFSEAKKIYLKILATQADYFDALQLLGALLVQTNQFLEAVEILGRALQVNPNHAVSYSNCGNALNELRRFEEAINHYDKAISIRADYADAYSNRGNTLVELGRFDEALKSCDQAIRIKPDFAEALSNRGNALTALKRFNEALASYDEAIRINPDYINAHSNRGNVLTELGRFDDALESCDLAIRLEKNYAGAHCNRGNVLFELKRFDEALISCDEAIRINPTFTEAYSNRGNVLSELKRFDEALESYDKAIHIKPDYAQAFTNRCSALVQLNRLDEALKSCDAAILIKPDYAQTHFNYGVTLYRLMRYGEAIIHFEKALSLDPDIDWADGFLIHLKMKVCIWSGLQASLINVSRKLLTKKKTVQPFMLLTLNDDAQLHKKISENYVNDKCPSNSVLGLISRREKKEKIRIAYFSPDFRNHPVSFLTAELFERHDRNAFEVIAFSLQKTPDDDETSIRLKKGFDQFIEVENMSDSQIAQLSRELEVDIAIDLAGLTQDSRTGIFSYRAAPIQVNWLGYPGTIGASFIDYIIADKIIIPESHQAFYTEKIAYLPNTYMVDDSKRVASSRIFTREECGLPENAFVFCCFNNDYKFNPQLVDCWSRILKRVENSVLWISENNMYFKTNIRMEFQNRGVNPDRIIFAQRLESMADHLARYSLADLFLDTYPYNAHTTAVDSLKAGVPVITLMGQSFASRVAASLLSAIELPELITNTQDEYEALAAELATSQNKLIDIKIKLIYGRFTTPLFDTLLFTQHLESAYVQMMERYWNNFPSDHIHV